MSENVRPPEYHRVIQSVRDLGSVAIVWAMDKILPREAVVLRDLDTPLEEPSEPQTASSRDFETDLTIPDIAGREL